MGQNRVLETRVASMWYCFVTGTTNYMVWILLLVTHFGPGWSGREREERVFYWKVKLKWKEKWAHGLPALMDEVSMI